MATSHLYGFGEGPDKARVMIVGEQPGDAEDRAGLPFVGPAGQMLNRALAEAGVNRDELYVTNAVKHFKWTPAGKRRLHAKPSPREMAACRPWLEAEIRATQPALLVCLGGTAAASVLGRPVKVTEERGEWVPSDFGPDALVTFHPAALLRQPGTQPGRLQITRFSWPTWQKFPGAGKVGRVSDPPPSSHRYGQRRVWFSGRFKRRVGDPPYWLAEGA